MQLFGAGGPAIYSRGAMVGLSSVEELRAAVPFRQATSTMYGRSFQVPRLECWMGCQPYRYGGQVQQPRPWPPVIHRICDAMDDAVGVKFDSVFANLYEGGHHTIGWHADDDDWIGPWIASVTFGAERRFLMRPKHGGRGVEYHLGDGDLLVMPPGTQAEWLHHVPKTKKPTGRRINLTFRQTIGVPPGTRGV